MAGCVLRADLLGGKVAGFARLLRRDQGIETLLKHYVPEVTEVRAA